MIYRLRLAPFSAEGQGEQLQTHALGKKKTRFEEYRDEVFGILGKMKPGYRKGIDGYNKLIKLNENIYDYAKNHGDEECLKLWRVVSRIGYSFVSEEHEYLGRLAEEEIHFKTREEKFS
mgnify:CR=1 FL=1